MQVVVIPNVVTPSVVNLSVMVPTKMFDTGKDELRQSEKFTPLTSSSFQPST
jgi:hypothetical protein